MKTTKEYPATHSMWTAWFAIDKDGNVAIMECDDNGPAPVGKSGDTDSEELLVDSLVSEERRIQYTDEQLLRLMSNSISSEEYLKNNEDYDNVFESLCVINPAQRDLLLEAASLSEDNKTFCLSEKLNLWYIYLSQPFYLDNSGSSRYGATKHKIEKNELAKRLYRQLFETQTIKRIVSLYWPLGYDYEEVTPPGRIRHSDSLLNMYFQDYDCRQPSERMLLLPEDIQVKESQLPEAIKESAVRLPISFKDSNQIQLAAYVGSYFYGSNYNWEVDGQTAQVVNLPDGTPCFVGNGGYFEPIPLEEAFKYHKARYTPLYPDIEKEYRINGKRGYLKYENQYYRVGSRELFDLTENDTIEVIEDEED